MKLKVLPITMAACLLLIVAKIADISGAFKDSTNSAPTNLSKIETAAGDDKAAKPEDKKEEKAPEAKPEEAADKKDEKVASDKPEEATKEKDEHAEESDDESEEKEAADATHGGGHGESKEKKKEEAPQTVHDTAPAENLPKYNDSEKVILEKLAARRAELDAWAKDLEVKEQLVDASSKKLDTKLDELKKLKEQTEALLVKYNEHEDAKIKSLVKMYEAMKPAAAASIIEEMDMDIVLQIVDKMAEKKASPILAALSPKKAKNITQELANRQSLAQANNTNTEKSSAN